MIETALVGGAGVVVTTLLLRSAGPLLGQPLLLRENYRGATVPTAAGIVLVATVLLVEGARAALWVVADVGQRPGSMRTAATVAVVGFGLLGLVDDLLGDADDRGLRGHIGAAIRGRLTTGFLKLAVGGALGVFVAAAAGGPSRWQVLVDGALIALTANMGNLLDRAPGRLAKWSLAGGLAVLAAASGVTPVRASLALVLGACAALMIGDLRERFMLGDTGANAIGAAIGVAVVAGLGPGARQLVVAGLVGLTVLSEVVPFSRIIAAVPPLRLIDDAGRRRSPPELGQ